MAAPSAGEDFPLEFASAIERGDPSAEDAFARHFGRRIFALALARLRNEDLAHELAQEILIASLVALRAGRLKEHSKLTGFVLATARNRIAGHFRAEGRKPVMEEAADTLPAPAAVDRLELAQRREHLRKAMQRLDAQDREILRLNLVESIRPEEIGKRIGLTPVTVRQRKSRALGKLAQWMERFQSQKPVRAYSIDEGRE